MWFPVLGVVCVGLFVGAAVAQFKQHRKQQESEAGEVPAPEPTVQHESDDDSEPE